MKKVFLFLVAAVVVAAFTDAHGANATSLTTESVMTMTTTAQSVTVGLFGSGTAMIDWGDGSQQEIVELSDNANALPTTDSDFVEVSRLFSNKNQRQITITGANIMGFDCSDNQLTNLDVTQNIALRDLSCFSNQLTELDVSQNIGLLVLYCFDNQLIALDVSQNTMLITMDTGINQLTILDLS